jgi:hypothetical protein
VLNRVNSDLSMRKSGAMLQIRRTGRLREQRLARDAAAEANAARVNQRPCGRPIPSDSVTVRENARAFTAHRIPPPNSALLPSTGEEAATDR